MSGTIAGIVNSRRLLLKMQKAGWIEEPGELMRPKPGKWGKDYCYVDDIGPKALGATWRSGVEIGQPDCEYRTQHVDGCFFPFIHARARQNGNNT